MRCLKPKMIVNPVKGEQMSVRCGKCYPCRNFKAGSWTIRLLEQEKCSKDNWFVTLTLSDDNLTWAIDKPTLSKRDLQLFFKTLRNHNPDMKFKYYAVGEYGENTKRPHYHLLIFNSGINDKYLMEKVIEDAWNKGFVHIGDVTSQSIRYVAGYLEKGIYGETPDESIQRLFNVMSKGIGIDYVKNTFYYHHEGKKFEYHQGGGRFAPLPRYYRNKIFSKSDQEEYAEKIKVLYQANIPKGIRAEENDLLARINRIKAKQSLKTKRK